MRKILSNLTAALLALHTVLGCCWHHEHRCTEACSLAGTAESSHRCDAHHSFGDGPTVSSPGHEHHGPHACQGDKCNFVEQTRQRPSDSFSQTVGVPADHCGADVASAGWGPFFDCDPALPPLRLHLIHHVLLI
jgi:hypothetical protein